MKYRIIAGIAASVGVAGSLIMAAPVYAWHPKGVIIKKVQNITTKSAVSDANTTTDAVAAKPGDILEYTIEIRNDGAPDDRGWNDMAKTVLTDTLPEGVDPVDATTGRAIKAELGLIKPGQKVAKAYRVKVVSTKSTTVTNKACFTGNSTANDNPQQGCDVAVIKVDVPVPPVKPEDPKKPVPPVTPVTPVTTPTPKTPETPAILPETGTNPVVLVGATVAIGYIGHLLVSKRKRALQ